MKKGGREGDTCKKRQGSEEEEEENGEKSGRERDVGKGVVVEEGEEGGRKEGKKSGKKNERMSVKIHHQQRWNDKEILSSRCKSVPGAKAPSQKYSHCGQMKEIYYSENPSPFHKQKCDDKVSGNITI